LKSRETRQLAQILIGAKADAAEDYGAFNKRICVARTVRRREPGR
jgi:hypothetical protein